MADGDEPEEKKRPSPPPLEFLQPGESQAPLPPRDQPAAWVPRPEDYQPQPPWRPPPTPRPGASNLPRIAGVLLAASAILGMSGAIYGALNLPSVEQYRNITQDPNGTALLAASQICGLISIWSQAMALLGGVMAYQRMNWKLTVVCAIFSLLTLGFLFEASLIGVLALIITIRARRYFIT